MPADATEIITGGMPGVGMLAERYADDHGLPKLVIKASYVRMALLGMTYRRRMIVDTADKVVAIWDGKSRGTQQMIAYAQRTGKPIDVHIVKDAPA
jgi:hypothetical protein